MLVPLGKNRALEAADPFLMDNRCIGHKHDAPTFFPKTHAQIEVFAMEKIPFVKEPDIVESFALDEHTRAGDGLYFDGFVG